MATDVVMPQMGESIAEGTITKWLVKVGDKVERDQPLFEISTDKVDAEIPSPAAGTLLDALFPEGATVPVNTVVAHIGEAGEKAAAAAPPVESKAVPEAKPAEAAAPAPAPKAAPKPAEPSAPAAAAAEPPAAPGVASAEPAAPAAPAKSEEEATAAAPPAAGEDAELAERIRRFSSPLVRNIAAAEGVDLSELEGSGVHGRVTKSDILTYLDERRAAPPAAPTAAARPAAAAAAPASAARPTGGFSVPAYTEGEEVEIEPMSKIRQITAAHMVYSKATSAHVTTVFHIDMSRIAHLRARARRGFEAANGTKLTYMPFIFKAVSGALKAIRKLNASIDGTNVVYKKHINLGIAVAMERGLIVPVIKDADRLSLIGLAKAANDLAERARGKKLSVDETKGGTFTITNPGVFGSLFGTPVINQPQVAILGIGTIEKRPVVTTDAEGNDSISIRTMSYFAITYDHRLVDGADADELMNHLKKTLEQDTWGELDAYL